jgi:AcrR family transcriptional regulator
MLQKIDRRTLKTRAALLGAFRDLVLSRGYEAVAVGDIVRRAGIGRSTFYLHFTNKEALLKESLNTPCSGLASSVSPDARPQPLVPLLEHFREQRVINRVFFEYPIRPIWVRRLAVLIEQRLARLSRAARMSSLLPRPLVALTIAEMQVGLITHWLNGPGSVRAEKIADALVLNTRALLGYERAAGPAIRVD